MKIVLDKNAFPPVRAHETDAGLDIRCKEGFTIPAHGSAVVNTGVHVQLPKGTAGLLVSKSGLNIKHDITSPGLIDEGYTGEIVVKMYNHGKKDYNVKAGDKIPQLVVVPVLYVQAEQTDSFDTKTARGNAGFGSTGK